MKKTLSVVLLIAMLLSTCSVFAGLAPVSAAATTIGDLNNDGRITAVDSLLMRKLMADLIDSSVNTAAADINADGKISIADLVKLRAYIAGAIDDFDATADVDVKEITIGGTDISQFEIVVADPPAEYKAYENYHFASRMLRNYIQSANGYTLNITYTPTKAHRIYLVFEPSELGKEGYRWETRDGNFYITGGYRRGCTYGVYDFLQKYIGWRFFEYELEYCFPSELVNVPEGLDYTYIPPLEYRDVHTGQWMISYPGNDTIAMHCTANKVNSHSDRAYMQSAKYGWGEGNVWANAHSFYLIFGIKNSEQPCLSNPYAAGTTANWIKNLINERSTTWDNNYLYYNLSRVASSWNDNENYCMCDNCKAIYQEEQSIAGTIVRFNNQVASIVNATYPDLEIYYIAYGSARIPPVKTKPEGNIVVCYCWNGCNNHLYNSDECSEEGNILGYKNWEEQCYFEAWSRISPKLFAWYYATSFGYNIGPCPNILNIREDFRYWAENNVVGIYAEAESDATMSFEGLRNYLMAQCMWNPYMSEEEYMQLIDEYLMVVYGDGWKYIKEYIFIQDEAGNRSDCFVNNFDWPGDMYDIGYMYDNYDRILDLFNKALAAATESSQKERIELLSVHVHFLCVSGAFLRGHGTDSVITERYRTLYNLIQKYQYVAYLNTVPSTLDTSVSPMIKWPELCLTGKWIDWYRSVNRRLPRDTPNYFHYYMEQKPTKTFDPFENLGK